MANFDEAEQRIQKVLTPRGQADIDVQPYLRAITTAYAKWWQLYTLTDAQTKTQQESSPFDFGLMVQTVVKGRSPNPDDPNRQDKEKIERFPVLEGIRKYVAEHRQVLLVGRPGSGKSTTLARLLLEEARGALTSISQGFTNDQSRNPLLGGARGGLVRGATDRPTPPYGHPSEEGIGRVTDFARIPVLVELRFWSGSILDRIQAFFQRHGLLLDRAQIKDLLFHRRLLLLMDGLNELPSEAARLDVAKFRQDYPQVSMIFTTRDLSLGGDFGLERKLEMQPLTEDQMKAFVRSYVPEQAEAMLRQLKERLREFGQTPLLLWMLCGLFRQTGQIPNNLGEVFRAFTRGYERNLKADVPIVSNRQWWPELLQELAFTMMHSQAIGANGIRLLLDVEFRVAIPQTEARQIFTTFLQNKEDQAEGYAQKCLDDLLRHHLIQLNGGQVEFRHQLIQEYYAAEELLEQLPTLNDEQLKQTYLNFLKWTEPLALMLALVEDQMQAERVVRLAIKVDLMLAARLAGEVKPEFQGKTVSLITALEVSNCIEIELFGETRSEKVIPELLKFLKHGDSHVRWGASNALGKLGSEKVIPELLQILEDEVLEDKEANDFPSAASLASFALETLGSEQSIPGLLDIFAKAHERNDSGGCWYVASTLGKLGSEQAIPSLLKMLKDKKYDISQNQIVRAIIQILEKASSNTAILVLLKLAEDQKIEFNSYQDIVRALVKIGNESVVAKLSKLATGGEFNRKKAAVEKLEEIGSESATLSLINLVEIKNYDCQYTAIKALCKIGSEAAIPSLLNLISHEDNSIRFMVSRRLKEIGSKDSISGLLKLCENENFWIWWESFQGLAKVAPERVDISVLIQLAENENMWLAWKAIDVLCNINPKGASHLSISRNTQSV